VKRKQYGRSERRKLKINITRKKGNTRGKCKDCNGNTEKNNKNTRE
jgi:hypothetical protein